MSSNILQWLQLPVAHVLIRARSSPGGTGGYVANTSAAYENQALQIVLVFRALTNVDIQGCKSLINASFCFMLSRLSLKIRWICAAY